MLLVINNLRSGYTHTTYTCMHTDFIEKSSFKKPAGACWPLHTYVVFKVAALLNSFPVTICICYMDDIVLHTGDLPNKPYKQQLSRWEWYLMKYAEGIVTRLQPSATFPAIHNSSICSIITSCLIM